MDLKFKKRLIDEGMFEACAVFDVNGDGVPDIVCGDAWYEGPDFTVKHVFREVAWEGEYRHDFSDFGMDVDGDGRLDIISGSWWSPSVFWLKNPGGPGEWIKTDIVSPGAVETIRYFDLDGCGTPEILPNTPGRPQLAIKLTGPGEFAIHKLNDFASGHGMGVGDINGDGRPDIILSEGWLEHPEDTFGGEWKWHPEFKLGSASVPILTYDVTGNGLADIIVGSAHGYGLFWYEQQLAADGSRTWLKHVIDEEGSQYHDMQLIDIDGDGRLELVTGKRWRAHNGNEPGDNGPVFIYYFKIKNGVFEKHVIDYGPAGTSSGAGIYFWMTDLTGNGLPDIVAPGKEGLYLFENLGYRD